MSAIASFYLISDDKRGEVIKAAKAQSLWDFLQTNARELEGYPFSGYLLLDLELLVPDSLGSQDGMAGELADILKSSFVSYRPEDASQAIEILNSADFTDGTIRKFLAEEGREDEYPDIVEPIQQSVEHLKKWLSQVPEGSTGILSIG